MDSSVRGPFIPPMLRRILPWWSPFLSRLISGSAALMGSTISCQADPDDDEGSYAGVPHVQSHAMAMTQEALQAMREAGIMKCTKGVGSRSRIWWDTEASVAVLRAGLAIDCLMVRYQGVDWLDVANWRCNAETDPLMEFSYDGVTLDPYETVFARVDKLLLQLGHPAAEAANKYDQWMHHVSACGFILILAHADTTLVGFIRLA